MRAVSERFAALIPHVNRWTTEVEWSNDGFATFDTAGLVAGAVTASSLSQTRWTCNLRIAHGGGEPNGASAARSEARTRAAWPGEAGPGEAGPLIN
jgi:hypothetical protein